MTYTSHTKHTTMESIGYPSSSRRARSRIPIRR